MALASAAADAAEPTPADTDAAGGANGSSLAAGVRAAEGALAATAFVSLGKACLSLKDLTERLVPVFVRELSSHRAASVRNNVLIVLWFATDTSNARAESPHSARRRSAHVACSILRLSSDLAKRHTSIIDRHVPAMARALHDTSPLVSQHAMLLLAQLLLEDFIKCVDLAGPDLT
jgi:hypothetical protein